MRITQLLRWRSILYCRVILTCPVWFVMLYWCMMSILRIPHTISITHIYNKTMHLCIKYSVYDRKLSIFVENNWPNTNKKYVTFIVKQQHCFIMYMWIVRKTITYKYKIMMQRKSCQWMNNNYRFNTANVNNIISSSYYNVTQINALAAWWQKCY